MNHIGHCSANMIHTQLPLPMYQVMKSHSSKEKLCSGDMPKQKYEQIRSNNKQSRKHIYLLLSNH